MANKNINFRSNKRGLFGNNPRKRKRSQAENFLLGTTGLIFGTVLTVEAARALGRL